MCLPSVYHSSYEKQQYVRDRILCNPRDIKHDKVIIPVFCSFEKRGEVQVVASQQWYGLPI